MTFEDLKRDLAMKKYWICCPMCDITPCVRGTSQCEAEIWQREKEKDYCQIKESCTEVAQKLRKL